jgi:hypothetical protein
MMHEQHKNTIIAISVPRFGSNAIIECLKQCGMGGDMEETTPKSTRYKTPDHRTVQFTFNHYRKGMAKDFLNYLAKVFHPDYLKIAVAEVNAFKDEWEFYENQLKNMDWYYAFSDDHRVWCAGEAAIAELKTLRENLSKEDAARATKLWEQYSK